jgi:ribose 5-phosphate isomerase A
MGQGDRPHRRRNRAIGHEEEKQAAAEAAASLIHDGMRVGLGTGTTVAHLLPLLPGRKQRVTYVASSPNTERAARELGLEIQAFDTFDQLDLAIDGADQVAPDGWLIKGGGGAQTREKILAAAAERFVVIVSEDKLVDQLHPPVPLELLRFGLAATLNALAPSELRAAPPSPDGGVIADYHGSTDDPGRLAARLSSTPGVIEHGLFEPQLVGEILVARSSSVETLRLEQQRRMEAPMRPHPP